MKTKVRFIRLSTGHIQLRYNNKFADGSRFAFGTGVKVDNIEHWSKVKQRQKPRTKNSTINNNRLTFLESRLVNVILTYSAKGINPTISSLKVEFKKSIGQGNEETIKEKEVSFIDYIDKFIEYRENEGEKSNTTIKSYRYTKNVLLEYMKYRKIKSLSFGDIDVRLSKDFIAFLKNARGVKSNNAVDKYLKHIKLFMKEARKDKYHTSTDYEEIKRMNTKVENVYLTEEEISKIYSLNLSSLKKLDRVRDFFLIGCYTGLRFSDFTTIKKENIKRVGERFFISKTAKKTNDEIVIPITPNALKIFEKYQFELPQPISNQKFNEYIKEVCELAGITSDVSIKTGVGIKTGAKYKYITTHTARRSFATNAFLNRVPTTSIMKVTGHKTEKEFQNYIKIGNLENANHISILPFFSQDYEERKRKNTTLRKVS